MEHNHKRTPFWRSRFGLGWLVLAGVAGWFLWEEHRAHLLGVLPYLVFLACPLMHVFMHGGHHHGGGHHQHGDDRDERKAP
ncbi:DUF2933 domain-containing protein [Mitsuaria sp. WAJ17]|uniref:DUF2933 domain-containing protein n=1 Tax=Mitsuaria sp. WAJ17 TaxID=2761452 RepID=UPI0016000B53|nr:DUF2933 domain-containing protein [Mitsuaria sp. WAJ17]MBB2487473.1 DUF2933 domain-containing protein [Mitsuaria sp. WAJ17]